MLTEKPQSSVSSALKTFPARKTYSHTLYGKIHHHQHQQVYTVLCYKSLALDYALEQVY